MGGIAFSTTFMGTVGEVEYMCQCSKNNNKLQTNMNYNILKYITKSTYDIIVLQKNYKLYSTSPTVPNESSGQLIGSATIVS